jgi:hypothetical protein
MPIEMMNLNLGCENQYFNPKTLNITDSILKIGPPCLEKIGTQATKIRALKKFS